MRRTTPPTSSATSTPARWRSRTASSITRPSTASAAITLPTLPAPRSWPASIRSARPSWAAIAAGIHRPPSRPGSSTNSIAHGWSPIGAHQVKLELEPGETRQIVFVLGYHENPVAEKFDPPSSQTINKKTGQADDRQVSRREERRRGLRAAAPILGEPARHLPGRRRPTSTPTAWSISGMPISAWPPST